MKWNFYILQGLIKESVSLWFHTGAYYAKLYVLHLYYCFKPSLPTNAPAVIFLTPCDKDCIDSGKNSYDKCDGENCDMYLWWQCRGVWRARRQDSLPRHMRRHVISAWGIPQGHSLCEKDTKTTNVSVKTCQDKNEQLIRSHCAHNLWIIRNHPK